MIRATTGGVLRSYRSNLMKSFVSMNGARDTVLTQRNFNSYAEDPASAAKAFRLRKSRMAVESQYDVCSDTYHKYQSAFSCLDTISKLIDTENGGTQLSTLKSTTLKMLNDPTGDARTQLTKALDQMSETIVQNLNQKYGDNFIFAGADGHNVPFEVKTVDGKNQLFYRGVPVDSSVPNVLKKDGAPIRVDSVTGNIDPAGTGYLSCSAKLYEVPKWMEGANGDPIMLNANNEVVPATDPGAVAYLKADTDTIDPSKYDPTNNDPAVLMNQATGQPFTTVDGKYVLAGRADTMSKTSHDALIQSVRTDGTDPYVLELDGTEYYIKNDEDDVITEAEYDAAVDSARRLEYLMNEKQYVDIGLGFQEDDDNKLIESSGYNAALHGLTFIGFGEDADGDPKNIYSIVQRLKEISNSVDEGESWSAETYDEFKGLVQKLETAASNFKTEFTNMDAGTTKLKNNMELLEDNHYNLQEQYSELEDVNMADSITSFIWAQYCYNAALKVGNSVLSESLMDFLR